MGVPLRAGFKPLEDLMPKKEGRIKNHYIAIVHSIVPTRNMFGTGKGLSQNSDPYRTEVLAEIL